MVDQERAKFIPRRPSRSKEEGGSQEKKCPFRIAGSRYLEGETYGIQSPYYERPFDLMPLKQQGFVGIDVL